MTDTGWRPGRQRPLPAGRISAWLLAGLLLAPLAGCAGTEAAAPLSATFASPEELAAAVVIALEARDSERLMSLALSEAEFRTHVWPRLPASRAGRNVPFEFVWGRLHQQSRQSLGATLARHGGRRLEVLAVRFHGATTDYGPFVVTRDPETIVRDEEGRHRSLRLFGSILRQAGRYKLFSYVVD
ncbi:MAG TPA: hypothetical protein VF136_05730 [Methylomirabilota bacterium]